MTQLAVKRYLEDKEKEGKLGELRQDLIDGNRKAGE
jgi:hypothetical protein